MSHAEDSVSESVYEWTSKPIVLTNCALFIVILLYHIITIKNHAPYGFKCTKFPLSLKLSFILIAVATYIFPNLCLDLFDPFHSAIWCRHEQYISIFLYSTFKLTIYLILICRVHESFGTSMLAYDKRKLYIWASILVIWTLCGMIIHAFSSHSHLDLHSYPHCFVHFQTYTLVNIAAIDITALITTCYLFLKPILKLQSVLNKTASDTDHRRMAEMMELRNVAIKQCILSIIAVSTTLITVVLVGIAGMRHLFGSIDINLSILCIILMYRWNKKAVQTIFPCCLKPNLVPQLNQVNSNALTAKEPPESAPSKTLDSHQIQVTTSS
eukprot:70662_1